MVDTLQSTDKGHGGGEEDLFHGHLQRLDDSLRCGICHETLDIPLLLKTCGHSFCAACIRENIGFQEKRGNAQCPTCRVTCDARDLVPNLVLRGVVEKYHALVECVSRGDVDDAGRDVDVDVIDVAPRARRRNPPRASVIQNRTYVATTVDDDVDDDQAIDLVDEDDDFIPSQMYRQEKREEKKRKTAVQSNTEQHQERKSSFVQCPICNEHVFNLVLNSHIDSCLAQPLEKASNVENQSSGSTWKPLQVPPKLMGSLASEKSIRQALRKYSLPATEGRKADLIDRYNRFRMEVTLANDKQEQTTYEKIAWRVSKKEKRRAAASLLRMDMQATTTTSKAVIDMTDHTDIDAYSHPREVQIHGSSFEELIRVTKLRDAVRKKMRAKQATHAPIDEDEEAAVNGHGSSC
ncbi:hypothetical protein M9435_001533 [Picochlorum sp. BPE23]|nr:hypothetical protein M9435_001533 [Picochlorum sp. BPE23]